MNTIRLPFYHIYPEPFASRLVFWTVWLWSPSQCTAIDQLDVRRATEQEEDDFESTGQATVPVIVTNSAYITEQLFNSAIREYVALPLRLNEQGLVEAVEEDYFPRYLDTVWWLWEVVTWTTVVMGKRSLTTPVSHHTLSAEQARYLEERIGEFLKDYHWLWEDIPQEVPRWAAAECVAHLRSRPIWGLKIALENLFLALERWNNVPYDVRQLCHEFLRLIHNIHGVYRSIGETHAHHAARMALETGANNV